jgi:acyl-coenzyme A synthetase/AMP-(fatty) acid ligase
MNLPVAVHTPLQQRAYRESGAWPQFTLADKVRQWSTERPGSLAVVDGTDGRAITFGRLCEDASRAAGWLRNRGIVAGDGISVQLPNRYETVVLYAAASMLGARLNPLLPNYRRRELSHFLQVSRARVFVTPAVYRGFDHAALAAELLHELDDAFMHVVVDQEGHAHDGASLSDLLSSAPLEAFPVVSPAAVSELIFTSGTESQPKAVMHTEETVNHSARAAYDHLGLSSEDVVWMPSPVGHSTGFNFGVRLALIHGLPVVLQDRWDPSRAAELIERHRCTYTLAASTFLTDLLRAAREDRRDIGSMRLFGCGGAPVAAELVREAASMGVSVLRIYGSTEGLIISWNQVSAPRSKREETDGTPLAQTSVSVWDDNGQPLKVNEVGELAVKGPNLCVGFFDDPARTAATFTPDGWLRTGDLGIIDDDGYVTVVGRKKETIIRGGLNIAPREIEDVLMEMPGVREVAVIGVADPRLGEIVGVYLVPEPPAQPTLEAVVAYLSGREMAKYKLPQYLELTDELPRTPTGKVRKAELTARANQERSATR